MNTGISLETMTLEEKIQIMERIWEDLGQNAKSQKWHGKVLRDRENKIEAGEAEFVDWEQAKKNIRDIVS